jgi:rod shape-determining protein MreC
MLKRPHYIAAAIVALLVLLVLNLPGRTTARLKLAIGGLFLPLFGLAGATQNATDKAGNALVPRAELVRQNENFRRENQQLRLQAAQSAETARENDRLRQLLGWQQQTPWKLKLARVILRDPANWWRTIQIDLGSRDGIRENLAVLTADGLVGRVSSVSQTRSQVVMLGDPNCRVSALVENDAHDTGVILSGGLFDGSFVELSFLSRNTNLKPGQNVVTSGLGGIFPKGIPIGKVVDTRQADYGLYTEAQVKLAANLSALEEVWVMLQ